MSGFLAQLESWSLYRDWAKLFPGYGWTLYAVLVWAVWVTLHCLQRHYVMVRRREWY